MPKRHRRRTRLTTRPTVLLVVAAVAGAAVAYLGWSATAGAAAGRFTATSAHSRLAPAAAPKPATALRPRAVPRRTRPAAPKPSTPKPAAPAAPKAAAPKATGPGPRGAYSGVGAADPVSWNAFRHHAVSSREAWNDAADSNGRITWDKMLPLYSMHDVVAELPTLNTALRDETGDQSATVSVSVGQPMFAAGDSYTSCARASNPSPSDARMTAMANAIADLAPGRTAFVRLGWEFNSGYIWKAADSDAANFVTCWKRWYAKFKAASPGLMVVWNPNSDPSWEFPIDAFWPGPEFVDAAGPDQYAKGDNGRLSDPDQWTGGFDGPDGKPVRNPRGINAWAEYIAGKGVPLAVPEWGVQNDGNAWSSADPAFIDQMRAAFEKAATSPTGLAYEDYFDGGDSSDFNCRHSLNDPACHKNPEAATRHASVFSKPYPTA